MPLTFPPKAVDVDEQMIPRRVVLRSNKELAEKALLDIYSAAGVLINEKGDILYFHGSTARYSGATYRGSHSEHPHHGQRRLEA